MSRCGLPYQLSKEENTVNCYPNIPEPTTNMWVVLLRSYILRDLQKRLDAQVIGDAGGCISINTTGRHLKEYEKCFDLAVLATEMKLVLSDEATSICFSLTAEQDVWGVRPPQDEWCLRVGIIRRYDRFPKGSIDIGFNDPSKYEYLELMLHAPNSAPLYEEG